MEVVLIRVLIARLVRENVVSLLLTSLLCQFAKTQGEKQVLICTANHDTQHIVYDAASEDWACCYGSGSLDCAIPSNNETFKAPAPELLMPLLDKQGSPSTTVSSLVVTSLVTPSPTASPSIFPSTVTSLPEASSTACPSGGSCTSNAGLTTAAKAGSGVAASIFGIAMLVTLLFLIIRRSRRRWSDAEEAATAAAGAVYVERQRVGELNAKISVELDSKVQVELPGSCGRVELP